MRFSVRRLPHVKWWSREGGRIVNITSVHEHTPLPEASAYTAAKHALGGLTKSMALELVQHNILVNAVAPGAIATPMNDMDESEVKEGSMPAIPLARPGYTKDRQSGGVVMRQRRQLHHRAVVYRRWRVYAGESAV